MMWSGMVLLALLAVPPASGSQPNADVAVDCEATYRSIPATSILDLLDPEAPAARRTEALGQYERLAAISECPQFGYTLGLLYRHGPDLPGNLLPRDIPRAQRFIRAMAENGYLPAYADLAEMVMRHGDHREQMKWTQVYLNFVEKAQRPLMKDGREIQFHRSAYNAHLLRRAEVVWRWQKRLPARRVVREDLNEYLTQQESRVLPLLQAREAGTFRRVSAQDAGVSVRKGIEDCYPDVDLRTGAATAAFIVEVLPSGRTGRVVLENFVPTALVADKLKECVAMYEFEPFDGDRPRTLRVLVLYGSPEGTSIRR